MKPYTLTIAQLRKARACASELKRLKIIFGSSVVITEKLCVDHADDCSWDWAARNLLSRPASAEYNRVTAPAWAEYNRVRTPAWAEYDRATAAAWAEYNRVTASALVEYDRATAAALAEYNRATARTFARLWISDRAIVSACNA